MNSPWLPCALLTIAACGPDVEAEDDGAGTSGDASTGAEPSSTSEPEPQTTADSEPGTSSTGPSTGPQPTTTTVDPDTGSSGGSSGDIDEPFEALCPDDREFEAAASGTNQNAHEGRLVWFSAVEPDLETDEHRIVVHLRATIEGGAFELSCPAGLTENFGYPSLAIVLDADDDGVCSDGDLAFTTQLFGWDRAQVYAFDGDAVYQIDGDQQFLVSEDGWYPVEGMLGFSGAPFCEYFFP